MADILISWFLDVISRTSRNFVLLKFNTSKVLSLRVQIGTKKDPYSFSQYFETLLFYQIFLSPKVIRCAIITYKQGIYELPHELPNELRLRILENQEISGKCLNFIQRNPSVLCLVSAIFYRIFIFSPNDSPSKTMKNVFYLLRNKILIKNSGHKL